MANIVKDGLDNREAQLKDRLGGLAYEHYLLSNQLKAIEVEIDQLQCVKGMNDLTRKDIDTQAAVEAAQTEAAKE